VKPIARGSVLGFFVGILPGSTHIIASFVSYAIERKVSKYPEKFGQGAIEGVAGPESANNSATSGSLIPLLSLGVPTGPIPAVMLAAIMIHGIHPGPLLIKEQPQLFLGPGCQHVLGKLCSFDSQLTSHWPFCKFFADSIFNPLPDDTSFLYFGCLRD
jgi:putative tricarboxylic transport membrane protein